MSAGMATESSSCKCGPAEPRRPPRKPQIGAVSSSEVSSATLQTELTYYGNVIPFAFKQAEIFLSREHKQLAKAWYNRLFANGYYNNARLKDKRNRYLLRLLLCLLSGEMTGVLARMPIPDEPLPPLPGPPPPRTPPADWESDTTWDDMLDALPCDIACLPCSVHPPYKPCPSTDQAISKQMDEEFRFFLYLARPYAVLLRRALDRTCAALWLQLLCAVREDSCPVMKGIRNDYMQVLLGYLHSQRLNGPFIEPPTWGSLRPLLRAAEEAADYCNVLNPDCRYVDDFLSTQPVPRSGAFCYVAVSGELLADGCVCSSGDAATSSGCGC